MKTLRQEAIEVINRWEGGFQAMPNDSGNWVGGYRTGRLIGTMRGVTPAVLARFRGIDVATVTRDVMLTVTLDEAAAVYERFYVEAPGISRLVWSPAASVVADIGWGSGPVVGIRGMQALSGAQVDGRIGPQTATVFARWLRRIGHATAVEALESWRKAFYRNCVMQRPENGQFLNGWINRANWYSAVPPTPWWNSWLPLEAVAEPPVPVEAVRVASAELPEMPPNDLNRGWLQDTVAEIGGDVCIAAENDAREQVMAAIPALAPAFAEGQDVAGFFVEA